MSTLDSRTNFAESTASGYNASATSITVGAGEGARFPQPSTDGAFNLVWFNSTDYTSPAQDPNREIVRCTARSGDTLTIVRAQEGTTASVKNAADKTYTVMLGPTAKMITDIETLLDAKEVSANKDTDTSLTANSDVKYPSQKAVKTYVDTGLAGKQATLGYTAENSANRGAANGYAPLGSDTKIPSAYLPAIAITDTFVVASQAAMLALTAETGDVAVRSDENKTYILQGTDPAILANWVWMKTPTDLVLSVNGFTGAVTLTTDNITEGSNLYFTTGRVLSAMSGLYESPLTISTGLTRSTNTVTANITTGVSGGQSAIGGTGSGENLSLSSTSHATKGAIVFGTLSEYDEVNDRFGVGTLSPTAQIDVKTAALGVTTTATTGIALTTAGVATLNNQQISNVIRFSASGWSTTSSAARTVDIQMYAFPVQGTTNPSANLRIASSINGGAYSIPFDFTSLGQIQINSQTVISYGSGQTGIYTASSSGLGIFNSTGATSLGTITNIGNWTLTPVALSAAQATSAFTINQSWNTTGAPATMLVNITNTASNGNSTFATFQEGGANRFRFIVTSATLILGSGGNATGLGAADKDAGTGSGTGVAIRYLGAAGSGTGYDHWMTGVARSATSGVSGVVNTAITFNPTSGTGTFYAYTINPTINQTGGASGDTGGILISPTLTSVGGTFHAIRVNAGKVTLAAATTTYPSLTMPAGTAPTTPANGDIWFDGTDIKMRVGGVTKTFTLV